MNTSSETPSSTPPVNPSSLRRVDQLIEHYASSHQHPRNAAIHFLAIPLIMLSLCGLIYSLHPVVLYVFIGSSLVYYARLSWVFLVTMALISALMIAGVKAMGPNTLAISVGIFVGAWIIQFVGHKIEGKKPSFFEDVQYLWVGPLFLLSKIFRKVGLKW